MKTLKLTDSQIMGSKTAAKRDALLIPESGLKCL